MNRLGEWIHNLSFLHKLLVLTGIGVATSIGFLLFITVIVTIMAGIALQESPDKRQLQRQAN